MSSPYSLLCTGTQYRTLTQDYHLTTVITRDALVSDLAQVLNVTSSELCDVSSSIDVSTESTSFAERLEGSFTSLIQPYRYTSYEISSPLRPTTILFGCSLPDELDGASIGQRAVVRAFETILSSAAKANPQSLYNAICDAHYDQGNDIKLVKNLFTCLHLMFAHVTAHSLPSNWNHYGTRLRKMAGWAQLIT